MYCFALNLEKTKNNNYNLFKIKYTHHHNIFKDRKVEGQSLAATILPVFYVRFF